MPATPWDGRRGELFAAAHVRSFNGGESSQTGGTAARRTTMTFRNAGMAAVMAVVAATAWSGERATPESKTVNTTVAKAIVYREGAQVTRQGKLKLEKGWYSVTLADLPITADPASLR